MADYKIKIAYAYEGLIYLPLFLAKELELFPKNVELVYVGGDKEAIQSVMAAQGLDEAKRCHFAFCDPFYESDVEATNKRAHSKGRSKPIVAIGCLIDNPPFWIYSNDAAIQPVAGLKELARNRSVTKVLGYDYPNTGYLYAKHLMHLFERYGRRKDVRQEVVDFSPKNEISIPAGSVLVTANIVKVAKAANDQVVYTYATGEDSGNDFSHLRDLVFTAILTRQEVLNEGLGLTIKVLDAVKRALALIINDTDYLKSEMLFPYFKETLQQYSHLSGYDDNKLKVVRDKVLNDLKECDIYSEDLTFSKEQWKRMDAFRTKNDPPHKSLGYYEFSSPRLPELIGSSWRTAIRRPSGSTSHAIQRRANPVLRLFASDPELAVGGIAMIGLVVALLLANALEDVYYLVQCSLSVLLFGILLIIKIVTSYKRRKFGQPTKHGSKAVIRILRDIVLGFLLFLLMDSVLDVYSAYREPPVPVETN